MAFLALFTPSRPASAECLDKPPDYHLTLLDEAVPLSSALPPTHLDWPDVAAFPFEGGQADRNHYAAVWEARDGEPWRRRVWLRLLDGCSADLTAGVDPEVPLAGDPAAPAAGDDPAPQRWPRVAVATDGAADPAAAVPAVVVVYDRTVDGHAGELWAQVFFPVADCADRVRCVCGAQGTGQTCVAPYWPGSGALVPPVPVGPVAIDDDADGVFGPGDFPDCTLDACAPYCEGGVPEPLGVGGGAQPLGGDPATECNYALVPSTYDVAALPGPGAGVHRFAVTWAQGDPARWAFFDVFEVKTAAETIEPLHETPSVVPPPPAATGSAIPAVRLDASAVPDAAWSEESTPALTVVPGSAPGVVALTWWEARPQSPADGDLQVAVYEVADAGAGAWQPAAAGSVRAFTADAPQDAANFACDPTVWSPTPALAAAGDFASWQAGFLFLAWDANAFACGWSLPDAHDEDVYAYVLKYAHAPGDPPTLTLVAAPPLANSRLNQGDPRFAGVKLPDGEPYIVGLYTGTPHVVLLYQGEPVAAAREDGATIAWQHVGADVDDPGGATVRQVWQRQFHLGPEGLGVGYEGYLPQPAEGGAAPFTRHPAITPLPKSSTPAPGNWQSTFFAIWSSWPALPLQTLDPWYAATIHGTATCGAGLATCGCDLDVPACEFLGPGTCGWVPAGCNVLLPCYACDETQQCDFENYTCGCRFETCGDECCARGEVCGPSGGCCDPNRDEKPLCGADAFGIPGVECTASYDAGETCGTTASCGQCKDLDAECVFVDGLADHCECPAGRLVCGADCCAPDQTVCDNGQCAAGCDDADPCTVDVFDDYARVCYHTPKDCDDEDACTHDACDPEDGDGDGQVCVHTPVVCEADTLCRQWHCDPGAGCVAEDADSGTSCSDGFPCSDWDVCDGNGQCQSRNCDDGIPCTVDSCDTSDSPARCVNDPLPLNNTPCDDGDECTTWDICKAGRCSGLSCVQSCDEQGCTSELDPSGCIESECIPGTGCVFHESPTANDCPAPCPYDELPLEWRCVERGSVGAPCVEDANCGEGLHCDVSQGFCAAAGVAGAPCLSDDHCDTSCHCDVSTERCVGDAQEGGACTTNTDCAASFYCDESQSPFVCVVRGDSGATCLDDAQCAVTHWCELVTHQCVLDRVGGENCAGDDACQGPLVCLPPENVCGAPRSGAGGACAGPSHCADSLFCDVYSGKCALDGLSGESCSLDVQCGPGLHCNEETAVCEVDVEGGDSCHEDSDCISGYYCTAGIPGQDLVLRLPDVPGVIDIKVGLEHPWWERPNNIAFCVMIGQNAYTMHSIQWFDTPQSGILIVIGRDTTNSIPQDDKWNLCESPHGCVDFDELVLLDVNDDPRGCSPTDCTNIPCGTDTVYNLNHTESWFRRGMYDMKSGNDNIEGTGGNDIILLGPGNDFAAGMGGDDVICGGDHSDRIEGGHIGTYVYNMAQWKVLDGDDTYYGEGGADQIWGSYGRDRAYGGPMRDRIRGTSWRANDSEWSHIRDDDGDLLVGGEGSDDLEGRGGDDLLFGFSGTDDLWGDLHGWVPGADLLHPGSGPGSARGGAGDDTICWFGDPGGAVEGGDGADLLCLHTELGSTQAFCTAPAAPDDGVRDECSSPWFGSDCACSVGPGDTDDVVHGLSSSCFARCLGQ